MQSFTMKREIVMETKNFVIIGNTQTAIENHISKALKLRFKTDDIIFFKIYQINPALMNIFTSALKIL